MKTYSCHKGINRPMEFRGLQAQYIWWVAGVLVTCLLLFAILHLCGISSWICLPVILALGGFGVLGVYRISRVYGRFGLLKRRAAGRIPAALRCRSRAIFQLSTNTNGKGIHGDPAGLGGGRRWDVIGDRDLHHRVRDQQTGDLYAGGGGL